MPLKYFILLIIALCNIAWALFIWLRNPRNKITIVFKTLAAVIVLFSVLLPRFSTIAARATYEYDALGNMVKEIKEDGEIITYGYDFLSRLSAVTDKNGTTKYVYGAEDDIVMKILPDGRIHRYFGKLSELDPEGNWINYIYLDPINATGLISIEDKNGTHYVVSDHLGSPSLITDKNGNIEQKIDYLPFGQERVNEVLNPNPIPNTTPPTPFGFTGQRKNNDGSGLLNYGARYYHPALMRFTQPDPAVVDITRPEFKKRLENPQSLNPYSYVVNNPVKYVDPSGEDAVISINDKNKMITIKSDIYIYGQDATSQVAQRMQADIMKEWNNGWSYHDLKTNQTYAVTFDVKVRMTKHPNLRLLGKDNNSIEVDNVENNKDVRSYVIKDYAKKGEWRGNAPDPAPHEFGHLLGLDDRYNDHFGQSQGWNGNIMAEQAMQGRVEQRNIDTIISPYMDKHNNRLFKFINKETTHHIAPRHRGDFK